MTRRRLLAGGAAAALAGCARPDPEALWPPIGRFVEAEGLRLHYTDQGEGPAVALIHGANGNLRDFAFSLQPRLAERGLRVVAFDRPGHGYSQRPPERGWSPDIQARALLAGARALGLGRAVVVGHSWGGAVATAWALRDPNGVAAAVSLAGATHPWGGDAGLLWRLGRTPLLDAPLARGLRLLVDERAPRDVLERVFRPNPVPPGYAEYIGAGLTLRVDAFRHNAQDLDRLNAALAEQAPLYVGLPMPVLAIHGLADRTVSLDLHARRLAEEAPRGRLLALPGVGHMPHHAAEARVVEAIARLAGR